MEVVAEGVWPENYRRSVSVVQRAVAKPGSKPLCGERRHVTLLRNAADTLRPVRCSRRAAKEIYQPRSDARHSGPALNEAHGVRSAGTQAVFKVVRQKFRFVGGHVHVNGTLTLAGFAGQAEIERVFHVLILP